MPKIDEEKRVGGGGGVGEPRGSERKTRMDG